MAIETLYPAIRPSLDLNFAWSKTLDPRITFSRASAATYYDGKTVAKAEENLLKYSNAFNSAAWVKAACTIDSTTEIAPDGTATATKITSTGDGFIYQSAGFQSDTYTSSIWIKSPTLTSIRIGTNTGSQVVTVTQNWTRVSCTAVGNTWFILGASGSFPAGSEITIWSAQVERRSQVSSYTDTTTSPITNYIPVLQTAPAGVPRFDHNPVTGESLGLLVEEQRTNLLTYSEQFDNAFWLKTNALIGQNFVLAPDGTLTGDKLIENSVNGQHAVSGNVNTVAGTYTLSVYLKAAERTWAAVGIYDVGAGTSYRTFFNLYSGAVGTNAAGNTATITPVGNGWFRCSVSRAITGSGTNSCSIFVSNADGVLSYQGDGYSGIYIWGAQLEAGAFPTSYIKTEASQVTRAADSASMIGANFSSWYRQDEGTIYHEAMTLFAYGGGYSLSDGTMSNRIAANTDSTFHIHVQSSGQAQASIDAGNIPVRTLGKVAGTYKANDFAASVNGGSSVTDTVGSIPQGIIKLGIGMSASGISDLNGWMKRITYYPKRLTDAQLQSLTT